MKKILFLLVFSLSTQVNFANMLQTSNNTAYFQEEAYNVERFNEYSSALTEHLKLDAGQQAAAKANIKRYLMDKAILDKSVNGLSQKEYNYRLEKLKIELTYKMQTTLNAFQRQQLENLRTTNQTKAVLSIRHMIFL